MKRSDLRISSLVVMILLGTWAVSNTGILSAEDWPVYKGNLYLTGNNDELIVKNKNIKWIFKGKGHLYNPIISDSMVYVIDRSARLFALDEETGAPVWVNDLVEISKQFTGTATSAGKIKYPLVRNNFLIITDATMIYAFDKKTGKVIWSRTAMNDENKYVVKSPLENFKARGAGGRFSPGIDNDKNAVRIDGIYSDPVLLGEAIVYGTRNVFIARNISDGHLLWNRPDIKSYSGFPTFYDSYIFTQSMDHSKNKYELHCLNLADGREIWKAAIEKPLKIFSPVVYRDRVYFPSMKTLYVFDLKTGKPVWQKTYPDYITSDASFTDQEILFSMNNRQVLSVSLETGEIQSRYESVMTTSPAFVLIRDQVYVASNKTAKVNEKDVTFVHIDAFRKQTGDVKPGSSKDSPDRENILWSFDAPFPGAISQPSAANGVLIVPAGEYLYALGDTLASQIKNTDGRDYIEKIDEKGNRKRQDFQTWDPKSRTAPEDSPNNPGKKSPLEEAGPDKEPDHEDKLNMRKIKLAVLDSDSEPIDSDVEITLRKNGKTIYSDKIHLDKNTNGGDIEIPDADDVEITASSEDHAPHRDVVNKVDKEKTIVADRIKPGETFTMGKIEFELNEAYLKPGALKVLDKLVETMKARPAMKLEIRGHTDSTGAKAYNQALSQKRAESVEEYLVKHGISPLRLTSKGYGDTKPVAENATEAGRARNRRTEFYVK